MSHYFVEDKNQESNIVEIEYKFKEVITKYKTDGGLFSKEHVDYASDILMREIPILSGKVLDLGCGYGPIGITMAKVYHVQVTFADVNPKAIRFTKVNCELNGIKADFVESDGFEKVNGLYNSIILNPPIHAGKPVIYQMYEDAPTYLEDGGAFYIIIQKKHGAATTIKKLESVFSQVNILYKKKGFFVVEAKNN